MYQSLYRKYRPNKFTDIYGQGIIKKILINSLMTNKISHAYLFFGPRGTGKTSLAKMFARSCNCLNLKNGDCCEECENCIESSDKNCVDIIEIDAASNNGVDEIRNLKNKINLVPNKLKYKVYIIDEVHMLSTGAFNALLKTLEEPPSHIIFILATTEFYKVPKTIVSRCQTLEFKNISNKDIFERLKSISDKEKINITDDALIEISDNSNGGLRDAIGLLDKISSLSNNENCIELNDVKKIVGNVSESEILKLYENIKQQDMNLIMSEIDDLAESGTDYIRVIDSLIKILLKKILTTNDLKIIEEIKIMDEYQTRMKESLNNKTLFTLMVIELVNRTYVRTKESDINLQNKHSNTFNEKLNNNFIEKNCDYSIEIRINNSFTNANKKNLNEIKDMWKKLNDYTFDNNIGSLVCDLLDSIPVVSSQTNTILKVNYLALENKINNNLKLYEKVLKDKLNIYNEIVAVSDEKWNLLKKDYLNNIKNNIKYEYIKPNEEVQNISSTNNKKDLFVRKAENLFGNIINEEE